MKKTRCVLAVIIALIMTVSCNMVAYANEKTENGVDVVFVIDDTMSMKKNDPKKLTSVAVSKYLDRIDTKNYKSKVGAVTFSQKVMKTMKLTELNDKSKKAVKNFAKNNFKQNGSCTNCAVGIKSAVDMLNKANDNGVKAIILVTDGEYDFDGTSAEKKSQVDKANKLLDQQIKTAKENDIKIFTIKITGSGQTANSGKVDFNKIVKNTDGKSYSAKTSKQVDSDITDIQRQLYDWISGNGHLKLEKNVPGQYKFDFPVGVVYANVQITHEGSLTVNDFRGKDDSYLRYSNDYEEGYTNIRVVGPPEGEATLTITSDKTENVDISYIIADDLTLNLSVLNSNIDTKEPVNVELSLMANGELFKGLENTASFLVKAEKDDDEFECEYFFVNYDETTGKYVTNIGDKDNIIKVPGNYTVTAQMMDSNSNPIRTSNSVPITVVKAPFNPIPLIIAIIGLIILAVVLAIIVKKHKEGAKIKPFGMFQYDYYNLNTGKNDALYTWRLDGMEDPKTKEVSVFKLMNMDIGLDELQNVVFVGAGDKKAPRLQVINRTSNWQVKVNALTVTTNPVDIIRDSVVEIRSEDNSVVITATRL